jgi:hypothetical protein
LNQNKVKWILQTFLHLQFQPIKEYYFYYRTWNEILYYRKWIQGENIKFWNFLVKEYLLKSIFKFIQIIISLILEKFFKKILYLNWNALLQTKYNSLRIYLCFILLFNLFFKFNLRIKIFLYIILLFFQFSYR